MVQPTVIDPGPAENVLQVHGEEAGGTVVLSRHCRRSRMLLFFRAAKALPCGDGSLRRGASLGARADGPRSRGPSHAAGLLEPCVKRGKTDAADAEAICEAVTRPKMRSVPIRSSERQAAIFDHVAPQGRLWRTARDFLGG